MKSFKDEIIFGGLLKLLTNYKMNIRIPFKFIILFFIWVILFLFCIFKFWTNYYVYLDSKIFWNYRYSLYDNFSWNTKQWVLFKHNYDYWEYKSVEISKVSLQVFNDNPRDEYIYHIYADEYDRVNPKIEVFSDNFLIFSVNWINHFVINLITWEKFPNKSITSYWSEFDVNNYGWYYNWKIQEIHNRILEIIQSS